MRRFIERDVELMKMFKKKVLFICGNLPYPIVSGGRKREFQLLSDIGRHFYVELLCITREIVSDMENSKYLSKYIRKIKPLPTNAAGIFRGKIPIDLYSDFLKELKYDKN